MIVPIENIKTGEHATMILSTGRTTVLPDGWRIAIPESTPILDQRVEPPVITVTPLFRGRRTADLAAMISSWGLPLASSLSALRWILGKRCASCEVAGEFLRLLEDGVIDVKAARDLVAQVLNAKDQHDEAALQALKGKLEALRAST